jgi:CheY-like chemotaxis protein
MRSILLIEPDVDVLGTLASRLRSRGLSVLIADSIGSAVERAAAADLLAVLVSSTLLSDSDGYERLKNASALSDALFFVLVDKPVGASLAPDELPHHDIELIARRLYAIPSRVTVGPEEGGDFRGDLQQVSSVDLLQLLAMNRRSGTLSINTPAGAGEVRIKNGEIVDAVFRRLEREKALYRLLGETDGTFSFVGGMPQFLERIQTSTNTLLMEGLRQLDEGQRLRTNLALDGTALLAIAPPGPEMSETAGRVLETLMTPRTLAELLDEVTLPDLAVLEALAKLLEQGLVRRIAAGAGRVELADPERMAVLAALAKRAARSGFRGPARVVVAATTQRLVTLMHAIARIADTVVPTETVPAAPVPYALATLRLGEADLEVMGLPLVEAYAPLWGLVLPGAAALARLELTASEALETACSVAAVPVLEGGALLQEGDDADPEHVATLLRVLLEKALGG